MLELTYTPQVLLEALSNKGVCELHHGFFLLKGAEKGQTMA
jgi:hypothetical protein